MSDTVLLALFIINIPLTLLDAGLGYHLAPNLLRLAPQDEENDPEAAVRSIRRMLSGVVMLYMFFNCLAYYRQDIALMAVVSVLIALDLAGQLYIRHRSRRNDEDLP